MARVVPMQTFVDFIQDELSKGSGGAQESRGTPFFKVPVEQRESNPKAYDPRSFAFGPYHANIGLRSDADYTKLQAVTRILGKGKFEKLVSRIQVHELSIRALYVEASDRLAIIDRRTLSNLLAVDAVTIYASIFVRDVFRIRAFRDLAMMNAILLENQIPLFVIQCAIEGLGVDVKRTLEEMVRSFSSLMSPFEQEAESSWQLPSEFDMGRSLLSCIYDKLTASSSENDPVSRSAEDNELPFNPYDHWKIPTASHLRRCGINFRSCIGSFDGITFDNQRGILSLPKIIVGDNTERKLVNLAAYEVTFRSATTNYPVTSYLTMMDCLLDDGEDVKVLEDCGVISNALGSGRELASMWNKLCVQLPLMLTLRDRVVLKEVRRMSQTKWRKWSAELKERYLEKPWLMVSLVVAFVLLVLSFLQTLYTMKPYVG